MPFQGLLEGRDEISTRQGLEDIAGGARLEGRFDDLVVAMHSQEDDCGPTLVPVEPAGDLDSGELRHGDVQDRGIWFEGPYGLEGRLPVLHCGDEVEMGLEKGPHRSEQRSLIVPPDYASHTFSPSARAPNPAGVSKRLRSDPSPGDPENY